MMVDDNATLTCWYAPQIEGANDARYTRPMVIESYEEDFTVVWADPKHADESWVLDRLHWPQAMAPLYQALHERIMAVAFEIPSIFVNGYAFAKDFGPPPATPDVNERGAI